MDGLIYAYYAPKSTAQQKYTQERLAARAEQRKQQTQRTSSPEEPQHHHIERTISNTSTGSGRHSRDNSHGDMESCRLPATSSSSSSLQSDHGHQSLLNNPFELRHGRRYLRDLPYPLPVDLPELQRQNLRTLLGCQVFGRTVCSPHIKKEVPQSVLEIGCGSGFWSAMCHDYFASLGHSNVSFTGMDVAPLAPDLKKQGINWTFVQHDVRRIPLPFEDEQFDLVMLKDLSLVLPLGVASQKFLDESIRILREGGTLEIWESDHTLRSLLPHPPPPSKQPLDQDTATRTATFLISPGTPFAPAQNRYVNHANNWIQEALDRKKLPPTPCARIAPILYQEPGSLDNIGARRVAIPLGELHWERYGTRHGRHPSDAHDSVVLSKGKSKVVSTGLTTEQAALRRTALVTVIQQIESMEPLLKEVSGKNSEEWSHWWASMMADLLDPFKGSLTGECLEMGAWWATKSTED